MKMSKFIATTILAATVVFTGAASANHSPPLIEGERVIMGPISACKTEGEAVSVVEELAVNGFPASLNVFNIYVSLGACFSTQGPVEFTPIRLVIRFKKAVVVEILSSTGYTVYLLSPDLEYLEAGAKPLMGEEV